MAVALRRLRDQLAAAASTGHRPLLIVDEAQLIQDPAAFETLRLLLNFTTTGPPDLALLLVGTAELIPQLPPGLADRLTARCLLGPFTESESSAYVSGRLAAAGATTPSVHTRGPCRPPPRRRWPSPSLESPVPTLPS